ncbi:hypothetical protein NFI96_025434 [Prochilodus magdalenae]|nr:hypothetical protein NFI96_025434 [Prochilodus magdalenae]
MELIFQIPFFLLSTSLEGCCDSIRVYDGPTDSYPMLGQLPQDQIHEFNSTRNNLTVVFRSDGSVTRQGFRAQWEFSGSNSTDPCSNYTVLDEPWRATNYSSSSNVRCDREVLWDGWYRHMYHGQDVRMPEYCVEEKMCGTHAPLWIDGTHPQLQDGVVTRQVCGSWNSNCCYFRSNPIRVKACPGNYYVYEFVRPSGCQLAYCAALIKY